MKKAKLAQTKKVEKNEKNESKIPELRKLAYIFGSLLVIFVLFYAIAYYKVNRNKNLETSKENVKENIQFDEILVANLFNQKNSEYYVLVYDDQDKFDSLYRSFINYYIANDQAQRVYYSNLNNTFNASYKTNDEKSNLKVTKIQDLKVKTDTLFQVKDGKIVNAYEGKDAIFNTFKSLIGE